ncbi:LptF/LptG family permease [Chryseobacterium nematophagum]|uniref:LptF/LptG family permease n=1 Tax=Chryseobacterium nematophagum TaxID=2305228 RepID=A0A3M7TAZ1_9FLAO|nr:LptF/LptG family permease [Chryseobacterium nematophagum]RNA60472.1 LptF/LptG family permease [Chryseobacterium nematophagum]
MIYNAYNILDNLKFNIEAKNNEINPSIKYYIKVIIYQQRIVTYSFTCIIFFLIGTSLGSIIRKGGMGLPVIIAIVTFIIFHVIHSWVENIDTAGNMNPYLAAWLPNSILFPVGIWMTYKSLTNSELFDVEKYKALLNPITKRFTKNREHKRYQ